MGTATTFTYWNSRQSRGENGTANAGEPWQWCRGFSAGNERSDTAPDFAAARANFEAVWREYLPNRPEVDFQACRDQVAWTGRLDEDRHQLSRFRPDLLDGTRWHL
jgi:hypothetical protein